MNINLVKIAQELAPQFQENAEYLDDNDEFASANYEALRDKGVFSALSPAKYGGC